MAVKRNIKTMKNKTSQYYTIFFNYANVLLFRLILNYADMIHIWNLLFMFVVKNDMKKIIVILAVVMASCTKQNLYNIPNVITPNGDGVNDTWVIPFENAKVLIYNRAGATVFQSDNYQQDFTGLGYYGTLYYTINNSINGYITVI